MPNKGQKTYGTDPVLDLPDALSAMATVSKDGHTPFIQD